MVQYRDVFGLNDNTTPFAQLKRTTVSQDIVEAKHTLLDKKMD